MKRIILFLASIAILLQGCAVTPDLRQIGPYPANYKSIIKDYAEKAFFDPYTMRSVSLSSPVEGHLFFQQGWITCLRANAKNRMGGYTGLKSTAILINNGRVVQTMSEAPLCNDPRIQYEPWPEMDAGTSTPK